MISRGMRALVVLTCLFFFFVIGFLLIEQRQSVSLAAREIREINRQIALLDTKLQEVFMEKSRLSFTVPSNSLRVRPVGYSDVHRVILSAEQSVETDRGTENSILQMCLDFLRRQLAVKELEI